jgi:NAD(P)-dependent dehydrogenase (short-subunit alcohol dehydrogenase family)
MLKNRIALVTGGGSGIGEAIARRFHEEGAAVFICGRRENLLREAAFRISPTGERMRFMGADLSSEDERKALVDFVATVGGGLDILVNNAGMMRFGRIEDIDEEAVREMMEINFIAPLCLTRDVLPLMRARGGGSIVNISSISGIRPFAGSGAYCASKAALVMLSRVMALENAKDAIRVNAICPGLVEDTGLGDAIFSPERVRESYDRFRAYHPLGRNGLPGDVAEAALFLASERSSWITGAVLPLDGGRSQTTMGP